MKNLLLVFHILLIITLVGCTKDKGVYVGEEIDGKRHGQGTVTYSNGKKYVGEFKNGKKHGQGTFTWSDGEKYEGEWKDGEFHGQGKLVVTKTDDDGTLQGKWGLGKWKGLTVTGEFKNNRFWNVQSYNDKGEQNTLSCTLGKCTGLR